MNINVWKWGTWWKSYYQNHHALLFPQSDDGKGPLNCDEERSAIRLRVCVHTHTLVWHARTRPLSGRANRRVYSSSGSARQAPAILWYQEVMAQNTSLTNSNYLHQASRWAPQLAWFTLRLKGKTGVSASLCFSSQVGWLAWGSCPRLEGGYRN